MTIEPQLGDFAVMRTPSLFAWAIRATTDSYVNHAVVYVGEGAVVEARPSGSGFAQLSQYTNKGYHVTWSTGLLDLSPETRTRIALWAVEKNGTKYSWLDIAALFFKIHHISLGKWVRNRITRNDKLICSQLVDKAYQLAGVHLFNDGRLNQDVTPGDLLGWIIDKRRELGLPAPTFSIKYEPEGE